MLNQFSNALLFTLLATSCISRVEAEIVFAGRGGVELVSIPQPSPGDGLLATIVHFRTVDPAARIVTFEGFDFMGNLHQVRLPVSSNPTPNLDAWDREEVSTEFSSTWMAYDSHILLKQQWLGGSAGCGFSCMVEANDESTTGLLQPNSSPDTITGYGAIFRRNDNEAAFFVPTPRQQSEIEFAYLVVSADNPNILMNGAILGLGIENGEFGTTKGASFGFDEPILVPFVPEPSVATMLLCGAVWFVVYSWRQCADTRDDRMLLARRIVPSR